MSFARANDCRFWLIFRAALRSSANRCAAVSHSNERCTSATTVSWLIFLALFVFAPALRAQETPNAPHAGYVLVKLDAREPDLVLTLGGSETTTPFLTCVRRCAFWAPPGDYSLLVTSQNGGLSYHTTLPIGAHTHFRVRSWNEGERVAGLIAGVAGPAAMVGGLVLLFIDFGRNLEAADDCYPACANQGTSLALPAGVFFGGLASTIIGWAIYGASAPRVDALREPSSRKRVPPRVGVLSLPNSGWGLGVAASF